MGAGTIFLLLVILIVGIGLFLAFSGVGSGLWARQTSPRAKKDDESRPTHRTPETKSQQDTEFVGTDDQQSTPS